MNRISNTSMTDPIRAGKMALTQTTYLLSGIVVIMTLFAGCSLLEQDSPAETLPPEPVDISNVENASPESLPLSKYGNPTSYVVAGKRYYTMPSSRNYQETGIASWYGTEFQGKRTSSGETYDNYEMTASHRTLPLPTFVKVTNKQNGRSVIVKVNDRGPFHNNRLIDLSYVAAVKLGIVGYGTGLVEVTAIDPEEFNRDLEPIIRQAGKQPFLQTGAFKVRKNAEHQRADIAAEGIGPVRILEPSTANRLYRVQVGPFKETSEAEQVAGSLKPLGIHGIIHYGDVAAAMVQAETVAMEAYTPEPVAEVQPTPEPASAPEPVVNKVEVAAITTEPVADTPAAAVSEAEVITMTPITDEPQSDSSGSPFKLWSWMKSITGKSSQAVVAASSPVAVTPPAPVEETAVADVAPPVVQVPEPEVAVMETETVAMASESADSKTGDTGKYTWKFWKWGKSESSTTASASEATAMDAETTAASEIDVVTMKTPAPEPEAAVMETETMAMASDSADSKTGDTGKYTWKFWKWGKSESTTTASAPEATAMDTDTAAASEMEVVTMKTPAPAPAPASESKPAPAPTAMPASTASVYLQTGAFRLRENVERLRTPVEAIAPGSFNIVEIYKNRTLYKIQIGPLADKQEAMRVKRELKAIGINPSIMAGGMDVTPGERMLTSTRTYKATSPRKAEMPAPVRKAMVAPKPVMQTSKPETAVVVRKTKTSSPAPARKMAEMSAAAPTRPAPEPAQHDRGREMALYQQAGAFVRRKNADRLQTRIIDTTREATVIFQQHGWLSKSGDRVVLHRVQVGPLVDKTRAMEVKRGLIDLGVYDSFPVYRP